MTDSNQDPFSGNFQDAHPTDTDPFGAEPAAPRQQQRGQQVQQGQQQAPQSDHLFQFDDAAGADTSDLPAIDIDNDAGFFHPVGEGAEGAPGPGTQTPGGPAPEAQQPGQQDQQQASPDLGSLQELAPVLPIAQYIMEQPLHVQQAIFGQVQQQLQQGTSSPAQPGGAAQPRYPNGQFAPASQVQGDGQQGQPPMPDATGEQMPLQRQGQVQPSGPLAPQKPQRPEKPAGYSEIDAMNDPESPSAKYQRNLLGFVEQMASYQDEMETYRQQRSEHAQQELARSTREQLLESSIRQHLSQQNWPESHQQEFMSFIRNPQPTLQELMQLYQIRSQQGQQQLAAVRQQLVQRRQQHLQNPTSAGLISGQQPQRPLSQSSQSEGMIGLTLDKMIEQENNSTNIF